MLIYLYGEIENIIKYKVDKAFVGSCGVNIYEKSVTTFDVEDGNTKKAIINSSKETYLVMDNGKFYFDGVYKFADIYDIDAIITLLKEENMLSFRFNFKGSMVVLCDLCLDELEIDIDSENNLYVKFSDHYTEEGDDIIEIPVLEHKIDLKEYVYQYIILAKPMKCSHKEGECDEDMLERLAQLNTEIIAEEVDPRWEALKNIKID